MDAYLEHVGKTGKPPSKSELERVTGMSRPTIYSHIKSMALSDISKQFKLRAATILEGVCKKAEEGDVNCAKLVLNIAYGWNEKQIVEHNNTNKSLTITFTNPDDATLKKITNNENNIQDTTYEDIDDSDN